MIQEPNTKYWSKSNDSRYTLWSLDLKQMIRDTQSDWSDSKQWIILHRNGLTDSGFWNAPYKELRDESIL